MFKSLNETKSKKGDKVNFNSLIMLKGTQKNNHGNLHQDYRGSMYRGVSRNGKSFQIILMIHSEKIYLCTTNNPLQAAILYDYVTI